MSKYNAPSTKALPSLSTEGSDDLAPKNLSSKVSKAVSAAAWAVCAAVLAVSDAVCAVCDAVFADSASFLWDRAVAALVDASPAFVVAIVACAVAVEEALVALAASTNKSHLALSVFVVKGCDPEEVWPVLAKKILFVLVSLTISL